MRFWTFLLLATFLFIGCGSNKQEKSSETETPHPDKNLSWMGQKAGSSNDTVKSTDNAQKGALTEQNIEDMIANGNIPEDLQDDVDSVRQHLTDSAQIVRDSIQRLREEEREKERAEKQAKVDYINQVYANMWSDGKTVLS